MAFKIDDKWVWDFWFAVDGADYHMFYLQANKSLSDPELRHWNVSIGHAVSQNLSDWHVLADALHPSDYTYSRSEDDTSEAIDTATKDTIATGTITTDSSVADLEPPDNYTTWTGSVFKNNSTWYMYYTGTKKSERGLVQRICLATSDNLISWHKHQNNPIVELNPSWYDGLNLALWHDASWRDPWVIKDPNKELYHMYIACRVNSGEGDGRGAVGYAYSYNLIDWIVSEPLFSPGCYGEMEVPQIEKIAGRYYLFCSVSAKYHSKTHQRQMNGEPLTGLKYFIADSFDGPYSMERSGFLGADNAGSLYSGKVVKGANADWYFLAFINRNTKGDFVGEIIDPVKIQIHDDGTLSLIKY